MVFTKQQLRAIETTKGNLQLIACAGSGTTEGVASSVVTIRKPGKKHTVLPRKILHSLLPRHASVELKERIYDRCGEKFGKIPGAHQSSAQPQHTVVFVLTKRSVGSVQIVTEFPAIQHRGLKADRCF